MKSKLGIRITWANGKEMKYDIITGWNADRYRAHLVSKYPDCQYIYINFITYLK